MLPGQSDPPAIRALYVADWDTEEPKLEFTDLASMATETQELRGAHNWSPDTSIRDVAVALRKNENEEEFDAILDALSAEARTYWSV